MSDVTRLLEAVQRGEHDALDRLLMVVYDELRRLAARKLAAERPGHTLQATALVHEAYLRLLGGEPARWENGAHFFGAAAEAMRRILVESARRKLRIKRGGGRPTREVDETDAIVLPDELDVIALHEALEKLTQEDPVKANLVKLRYFCGLSVAEAGEMLGVSRATADRYWTFARTWLFYQISKGADAPETPAP